MKKNTKEIIIALKRPVLRNSGHVIGSNEGQGTLFLEKPNFSEIATKKKTPIEYAKAMYGAGNFFFVVFIASGHIFFCL